MSFTYKKTNNPICKISDGDVIYYDEKQTKGNFLNLILNNNKFEPFPTFTIKDEDRRDIILAIAPQGAGKSYFIKSYLKNYRKIINNTDVYLLSKIKDDKTFKELDYLQVVNIENKLDETLSYNDFEKRDIVIFDDVDALANKDILKSIVKFRSDVLENGRHQDLTILLTLHNLKGQQSISMLFESNIIVIYLSSGTNYNYILSTYVGLNKKQIDI
jgi:hypothetical protein